MGSAMALGALISGGLVWWHPVASQSALLLPGLLYLGLGVVHLTPCSSSSRSRTVAEPAAASVCAGPPRRCARRPSWSGRVCPPAAQPGARRPGGGGAVLVGRDGRLRDVPADPAGRAARQRGRRGGGHGSGRERRLGPVRARVRPGRGRQPPAGRRPDRDPGPDPQRSRRGRHGSRRRAGRPHRRLRLHLHVARRGRSGSRRAAPPRGVRPEPVHRPVDELDGLLPRASASPRRSPASWRRGRRPRWRWWWSARSASSGRSGYLPALRAERARRREAEPVHVG